MASQATQRRLRTLTAHLEATICPENALTAQQCSDDDFTRSKVNAATISAARSKARFDSKLMAYHIDGGKDKTEVREHFEVLLQFSCCPSGPQRYIDELTPCFID